MGFSGEKTTDTVHYTVFNKYVDDMEQWLFHGIHGQQILKKCLQDF